MKIECLWGKPRSKRHVPQGIADDLRDVAYEAFKLEWILPNHEGVKRIILRVNEAVIKYEESRISEKQLKEDISTAMHKLLSIGDSYGLRAR